ncbi:TIGR00159 family protein [Bacillus pseudomycoides]|uniref:Diadenylate cyclase n=1 Tax=Bacillus pseudomycoides TaxID=64104 RepID=A0AA91V8D0_9BACI|nr:MULTISPECIES: diadenylate cyclase CdaA [Bacillus]PEB55518.1 TIGR00159 family protein [Bacillus sp. AFS098217]PED80391.1 TIGR00159 family protein [Bacillus pseudomycoides]PEU10183.1 TIGR00159 family protein [Bacillus sp. AFS019443]PEU19040.1 TIGR00159 family protein [Bacillus sp. AFS014408]PFW64679.1 TIGR00159 family protein [Bacillus sp. AFS075034]
MPFGDMNLLKYLSTILDIAVVWFVIYKLILVIRGTKAVQLLKGITVIIVVRILSYFLDLHTLYWLTDQVITWGFLAVIIIFQPEIRRALEQLGRGSLFSRGGVHGESEPEIVATAVAKATEYMGKRRIGALITLSRETGMDDYIETGIPLNANVSSELLINIFIPNTPLHDGAVIMQGSTIKAAACYLPLSESPFISKELGTRHRAAMGVSEVTDSITVVVSEETGQISLTKNGELHRDLKTEQLKEMLLAEFSGNVKTTSSSLWNWNWRRKRHG